jgi:hypothetical protein
MPTPLVTPVIEPASEAEPPSSARLVGDLFGDVQSLVHQEIALLRQVTLEGRDSIKRAAVELAPTAAMLFFGGMLLVLALTEAVAALLHWPNWAGYAGIGAILIGAAGLRLSTHRKATSNGKEQSHG